MPIANQEKNSGGKNIRAAAVRRALHRLQRRVDPLKNSQTAESSQQEADQQEAAQQEADQQDAVAIRRHRAKQFLAEVNYPHNIHPALVPGVSIEDQRVRYGVDKVILGVVGLLIIGFIVWGMLQPDAVLNISSTALDWVMVNLGWIFTLLAAALTVVLLWLAFSRYGRIKLGLDDEKPAFSTASWVAMLFAGGIGIGIIFFGAYEPLSFYLSPRPDTVDPASTAAVGHALSQAALHWG